MENKKIVAELQRIIKSLVNETREWNMNESADYFVENLNDVITDLLETTKTELEIIWELDSNELSELQINLELKTEINEDDDDLDEIQSLIDDVARTIEKCINAQYYTIEYCSKCKDKTVSCQSPIEKDMYKYNRDYCRDCGIGKSEWKSISITQKNVEKYSELIKNSKYSRELSEIYNL